MDQSRSIRLTPQFLAHLAAQRAIARAAGLSMHWDGLRLSDSPSQSMNAARAVIARVSGSR
jgi:threonine aldolase